MAIRRTRKEKEKARYPFILSWQPEAKKGDNRHDVKGQFVFEAKGVKTRKRGGKNADFLAKDEALASIRKDIVKSLILASLILGAEVVVYLAWF